MFFEEKINIRIVSSKSCSPTIGSIPLITQSNNTGLEENSAYVPAQSQPMQQTSASATSQPNIMVPQAQAQQQQQQGQTQPSQQQIMPGNPNTPQIQISGMPQSQQQGNMPFHQPDAEQDSMSGIIVRGVQPLADNALLESLAEVTQGSDERNALEDTERFFLHVFSTIVH